jgi:hypothetical protein
MRTEGGKRPVPGRQVTLVPAARCVATVSTERRTAQASLCALATAARPFKAWPLQQPTFQFSLEVASFA